MSLSFSNPEPADGTQYALPEDWPPLLRLGVIGSPPIPLFPDPGSFPYRVDIGASRLNINGTWYTVGSWLTPDRLGRFGPSMPEMLPDSHNEWFIEAHEHIDYGGGVFTSQTYTFDVGSPVAPVSTPELVSPLDGAINQSINTDWLKEMIYDDDDAEPRSAYTVYFSFDGGFSFFAQDDRSRYSILSYKMWLGVTLDYSTTYYWFVRKEVDEEITDSDVWAFTTIDYQPPALRTRQKIPYGGGAPITVPTGENNMMSINRLIVAGDNSIFYEDV
jgi:hypothetical protein